jgi:putative tryptophan/tyrosine transport system substrate-binding protein
MPVIGYLDSGAPEASAHLVAAFRQGLSEAGYVDGRGVAIEFRWSYYDPARRRELAADLVRRRVAVIVANGSGSALAAMRQTTTIPIVFRIGSDPVSDGLVASLNRPGGNVTGVTNIGGELGSKRFGLLRELIPEASRFAVLVQPNTSFANSTIMETQAAAATIGRKIEVLTASTGREIEAAFASLGQMRVDALLVSPAVLFENSRVQLATLAAYNRVPAIYSSRDIAEVGGLMSYGASFVDQFRQAGIYAGRILKGDKPADLPVMQPTRFELVINLQTARAFGITVPPGLLAIADAVIE